jgi:DtxR family Mn-dependent transcriptional regulator
MLGSSVEDYVKAIYKLSQKESKVTPSRLATHLGITNAAVTKMTKKLQDLKLVNYVRGRGLRLTSAGEKIALEVIRHHRLIELYLTEALGYSWDQVHDEAEKLEHVISEHFEDKIEELLGFPTHDPHGEPIPTKDGRIAPTNETQLCDLAPGQSGVIERVNDNSADMLSYLGDLGMYPGTAVEMVTREPFGGSLRVRVSGRDHAIGAELAENVFVTSVRGTGQ